MPRVEFTGRTSLGGQMYEAGDVKTLPERDAQIVCKHGWAKDLDGKIPTGELKPGVHKLEVESVVHKADVKKPGGK